MAKSQKTETAAAAALVSYVYNVKMVCGIQDIKVSESCGDGGNGNSAVLSRGIYSTEVNIFNYNERSVAKITKYYVPLVSENKVIGFEPEEREAKKIATIALKPNCATGDDCCGIEKLLQVKNMLNIGFLKIVSNVDLAVTAVYTAADLETNSVVSIDVEQITAKTVRGITHLPGHE